MLVEHACNERPHTEALAQNVSKLQYNITARTRTSLFSVHRSMLVDFHMKGQVSIHFPPFISSHEPMSALMRSAIASLPSMLLVLRYLEIEAMPAVLMQVVYCTLLLSTW